MTTAHGLNVIRIVVEELSTELELFTNKLNLGVSHVKEMLEKKWPVMKTHVQVTFGSH